MRITPLDVRKQEFRKSVRGFDCDEVTAFLETLSHEYEAVLVDNKHLREQFMDQDEKISEYQTMERTLRDTLMTAERMLQDTRENAAKEGKLIVQEANLKARGILEECRTRTVELRREIMALRQEKENYLARFEGLAQAQIQFISNHKSDFEDVDRRLIEMATSVVDGPSAEYTPSMKSAENQMESTASRGDQWRDYEPSSEVEVPVETPVVTGIKKQPTKVTAASVDMAAMGIPVPAVPRADLGSAGLVSCWPAKEEAVQEEEVLT